MNKGFIILLVSILAVIGGAVFAALMIRGKLAFNDAEEEIYD